MPDLRPVVDREQVLTALGQYFSAPITSLTPVEGGQVMRTFTFRVGEQDNQDYIVRFNHDTMLTSNLPKEIYIAGKLVVAPVPMSPVLYTGRLNELHFAISLKVPGQMVESLIEQEVELLMPEIMRILDAIHHIDVSDTQGYGVFDYRGMSTVSSWQGSLAIIAKEEDERDYFGKWYSLFTDTFLERGLFKDIYWKMRDLLDFCPTERYLVHGNYSLRNILADHGEITAVLDWVDAKYGDFVFDIAGLDFWYPWLRVRERFQRYYQDQQINVPAYEQRMLCYQYYIFLSAIRFYARAGDERAYHWVKQRLLELQSFQA
ncbi:phosphotransferase family protein [Tengunoibacter tsumagoiensis]|uniref:Aminoglycoside phosphotransferase domain-containing protein n=1 Tax=Tengunoibacter tsumagoiensis TaxID=2014871 RepID=A0A402A1G0_9CHLR|nr:aminoglycoside phosphotransferase family protein [Tengunoibacter tsumagoiensis]GCE12892.1 hypothetical protein KTT_27510 [Tengunoibacter tsumagoiensis]